MEKEIKKKLAEIIDPHTNINIVKMDLIKDIKIDKEKNIKIKFQPTSPFCPITDMFVEQIKQKLKELKFKKVDVEVVLE